MSTIDRFDRIDYMNARRNAKPASGGKTYARTTKRNPEHDVMDEVFVMLRDFRSWADSRLPLDDAIPF